MSEQEPSITYGHGKVYDNYDATLWDYTNHLGGATCAVSNDNDEYIKMNISAGAGTTYIHNLTALALPPSLYPKIFWRYKTSIDTNIKAQIILEDSSGHPQTVLSNASSTTFTVGSATIDFGDVDTLSYIRLYANSDVGDVHYDFVLVCEGVFTFPNTMYGLDFTPPPRYANIEIPSRVTDITQNLGSKNATVHASCNLDRARLNTTLSTCTGNDWKRPQGVDSQFQTDVMKGQVFIDIAHNSNVEPFQWLDMGKIEIGTPPPPVKEEVLPKFKVTLEEPVFHRESAAHRLELLLKEYSRCNKTKSNESYVERFGLNL